MDDRFRLDGKAGIILFKYINYINEIYSNNRVYNIQAKTISKVGCLS